MRSLALVYVLFGLAALCYSAVPSDEVKRETTLTSANSARNAGNTKDLTTAASDRTFHISKEYGQVGGYPGGNNYPYSGYLGIGGNSIYGPGTAYRGSGLNPGYRGYPIGPGGIVGGGHTGYGYYGNTGYGSGYNGYSGYGGGIGYGYGTSGLNGYASGGYDDGYIGRGGYNRYGGVGLDGYSGYGGYNVGYGVKSAYDPYGYRGNSYGSYVGYPSGYRGYS